MYSIYIMIIRNSVQIGLDLNLISSSNYVVGRREEEKKYANYKLKFLAE